jgi:hypothetical protein
MSALSPFNVIDLNIGAQDWEEKHHQAEQQRPVEPA